ncbi:hypothetical protein ABIA85_010040 [Bradyrhizobium sp. LA6.10]
MRQGRDGGQAGGASTTQDSSRAADKGDKQTVQSRERDDSRQSQSEHEKQGKEQTAGQSHGDQDHARQSKSGSDKSGPNGQTVGESRSDRAVRISRKAQNRKN